MMKSFLIFNTRKEAEAAEVAIRDEGARIFAEEGQLVDAQGRVVDARGRVLIDRFSDVRETVDGRWALADPASEDWMGARVRSGQISRRDADNLNAGFATRAIGKLRGKKPTSSRSDEIQLKEIEE